MENLFDIKINPYLHKNHFFTEALLRSVDLPRQLRVDLANFRHYGNKDGFLLIKGLNLDDDLMTTPERHSDVALHKKTFISESAIAVVGSALGELYGYKQESEGYYFNNIRPTERNVKEQSSESSDTFLELHTEIAFHNISPDFLLLYCLRSDRDGRAKTGVSSIKNAIELLTAEEIELLTHSNYNIGIDYSFTGKIGGGSAFKTLPILSGPKSDPYMIYDSDLMSAKTEEAAMALKALDDKLRQCMKYIFLAEGDLIIIDNKRSVHSRTEFKAYFDGKDRWLQRAFVKKCTHAAEVLYKKKLDVIEEVFV